MKLATIRHEGRPTVIVQLDGDLALSLAVLYAAAGLKQAAPATMIELIERGPAELDVIRGALPKAGAAPRIDTRGADWMAPQPRPYKVLGIAVNNNDLNKVAFRKPTHPMIFMKGATALTGHEKPVELLKDHGYSIPEPEIVGVIGKGGKNIPEDQALEHIFGYTITNDITASGVKFNFDSIALKLNPSNLRPHHTAWRQKFGDEDSYLYFTYHTRSKASDTFGPMGPWLTTRDEVADPNNLKVTSWVEGEIYTEDSTSNYMFTLQRCIAEASRFFTLEAGDIIHFGTAGKGTAKFPMGNRSVNLQEVNGTIDIEIEQLGRLSNPIAHLG